jgi:hypothetical protein
MLRIMVVNGDFERSGDTSHKEVHELTETVYVIGLPSHKRCEDPDSSAGTCDWGEATKQVPCCDGEFPRSKPFFFGRDYKPSAQLDQRSLRS